MFLSLYRKWRPRTFDEMCGQDHITQILKKQCAENRVSHAYLFCGTRGTGKTSAAKILAKAVNCEHPVNGNPCNECSACRSIDNGSATDVLEIDAASNNRVDNVRDLRDEVVYPPSVLKKRVYIIDEVHMLTDSAFNALLKTLEEPPEYVVFILATTELNELPPTVVSRCIRFDFSRINPETVKDRLLFVAGQENISIEPDAADLISELADGAMRDGLSLLEAVSNGSSGTITREDVQNTLGIAGDESVCSLLRSVAVNDVPAAMKTVEDVHRSSKDISVFINDLSIAVRDLIIEKQLIRFGKTGKMRRAFAKLTEEFTLEKLFYVSGILEETQNRISKYAINKRIILELAVIRMCDTSLSDSPKALAARIAELEKKIAVLSVVGVRDGNESAPLNTASAPDIEESSIPAAAEPEPEKCRQTDFTRLSEVYEFLTDKPSLCAYLAKTSITSDGKSVIIRGDRFILDMIAMDSDENLLSNAFSAAAGTKLNVVLKESDLQESNGQQSLIDEL